MNFLTGSQMGNPFQPVSNPTGKVEWTNVVRLPDDPSQVVVGDSRKSIYRLRIGDRVNQLAQAELPNQTLGTLAGVGNTLMTATSGPAADFLVGLDLVTLKEKFQLLLEGRVIWGPASGGDVGLVMTNDQSLRGMSVDGTSKFSIPLPKGVPVGQPLQHNGNIILCGKSGWVAVIDPVAGQLVGLTDLGQPLSATPIILKERLLVPGEEGVVYIIPIPSSVDQ